MKAILLIATLHNGVEYNVTAQEFNNLRSCQIAADYLNDTLNPTTHYNVRPPISVPPFETRASNLNANTAKCVYK